MTTYILTAIAGGILFGVMDGAINANPLARRLYAVYEPIARPSVNVAAGNRRLQCGGRESVGQTVGVKWTVFRQ